MNSKEFNNKQLPKPPTKPKQRNLAKIAKALVQIPYIIEADENDKNNVLAEHTFAVLLRPLKYGSYIKYEEQNSCSIDETVSKIMWILSAAYQHLNPDLKEEDRIKIDKDEYGAIVTPFGPLFGSVQRNTVELAAFILSEGGRIVGIDPETNKYITVPVDPAEIIERLDPSAIMENDAETNSEPIFMEILSVSNVLNMDEVAAELTNNNEVKDDELKNSTIQNEENSSDEK